MKHKLITFALLTFWIGTMNVANAAEPDKKLDDGKGYYASVNASFNLVEIGEDDASASFKPMGVGASFGKYVDTGVAIEFYLAKGLSEDDDLGIDMELVSNVGVLGRFESPEQEGFKLHLLLGYGASELEMKRSSSSPSDRELYHGPVFGGGAELRIGSGPYFVNLQGLRQYNADSLSIDTVSLGVRYEF